jgi:hypothetical protein
MRLSPQEDAAIKRMLFLRKVHWLGFFLSLPAAALAASVFQRHEDWYLLLVLGATLFLFGYTSFYLHRFKCPRCTALFFDRHGPLPMGTAVPLQRKCGNCGMRIK